MEKEEIKNYIEQLKNFEQEIGSEDDNDEIDFNFINDLNGLLSKLNTDVQQSMSSNISTLQIKVKKLNPNAVIPSYSKPGDAGMDLTAISKEFDKDGNVVYDVGLAFEIPYGYVGLLFPRSSNAKKELILTNSVGVIDSGYRGSVMFKYKPTITYGTRDKELGIDSYEIGERVGQIIILPYPQIKFIESETLSDTERGNGGFGSTGV